MITRKEFEEADNLYSRRDHLKHILRGFDSPHVETTVGLVDVNSASKHETSKNDDATWLHLCFPKIEKELKEIARGLIEKELGRIHAELAQIISS